MSSIRALTAATAFVLASQAGAAGLASDSESYLRYHGEFPTALRQAAKNDATPGLHAGGFMTQLESTLKNRTDKPQIVVYPAQNSMNMLVTAAVVPQIGLEAEPITVCAQKDGNIVGAWKIAATGSVTPTTAIPNPPDSKKAACNETIVNARNEINAKYAAMQQQQPPSAQTTPPPKQVLGMVTPQQ